MTGSMVALVLETGVKVGKAMHKVLQSQVNSIVFAMWIVFQ